VIIKTRIAGTVASVASGLAALAGRGLSVLHFVVQWLDG
jgi:hypothetical protein